MVDSATGLFARADTGATVITVRNISEMKKKRRFTSYAAIDKTVHYYAPREALLEHVYQTLLGDNPSQMGHYVTVWGPRQSGKTWVMREVKDRIAAEGQFEVAILSLQTTKLITDEVEILAVLVDQLSYWFERDLPAIIRWQDLPKLFTKPHFHKPLILMLDEFDSLSEPTINKFANMFRAMHTERVNEAHKLTHEKRILLHGLALVGVRSVLGIENTGGGSPFNVQRSQPIPNLTHAEVEGMFRWYERESGQTVEQAVIDRIFYETQGQPGLVCWLGEQLTESPEYVEGVGSAVRLRSPQAGSPDKPPLDMPFFEQVYAAAIYDLPNNNILNIISQAKQDPYRDTILSLFNTDTLIPFAYDNHIANYLYTHGVVGYQTNAKNERYLKFSSPFIQKRLFNYFSINLFHQTGRLYPPFTDLSGVITETTLNVPNLLRLYERYLQANRSWLLADVPLRKDLRIYEAVYHFNLYTYLQAFFRQWGGQILPEFPTGNGQIDLLIRYQGQQYGLEVKSFTDEPGYREGIRQAIRYAQRLTLREVVLVSFIEQVSDAIRQKYETPHVDATTNITVRSIFVATNPTEEDTK